MEVILCNESCKLPNVRDDTFPLFMFRDNLLREDEKDGEDKPAIRHYRDGFISLMAENPVDDVDTVRISFSVQIYTKSFWGESLSDKEVYRFHSVPSVFHIRR